MSKYLGFERLDGSLPIYRFLEDDSVIYYAPGYAARVLGSNQAGLPASQFENVLHAIHEEKSWPVSQSTEEADHSRIKGATATATALLQHARAARNTWARLLTRPYAPVCLTVYPENRCNLRCIYCYSSPSTQRKPGSQNSQCRVSLQAVRDAAEIVVANCKLRGLPFTLVIHGGGEPTLNPDHLAAILDIAERLAQHYKTGIFKYIATNGVMPQGRAQWLAQNFDLIGISCDGPEDIQKKQRPRLNSKSSTLAVERTANIIRAAGAPYHIRVTVTPQTVQRLEEITLYLCDQFSPQEIHIEPVYQGGRALPGTFPSLGEEASMLADTFIEHFTLAQSLASRDDIRVMYAGSRPWEIHGPYCQIFRDVLTLVPGDEAALCFKQSDAGQVEKANARFGWLESDGFCIDHERVGQFRELLSTRPKLCRDCFNQYHCVGGCPDDCALDASPSGIIQPLPNEFRCRLQMRLTSMTIRKAANSIYLSSEEPVGGTEVQPNG